VSDLSPSKASTYVAANRMSTDNADHPARVESMLLACARATYHVTLGHGLVGPGTLALCVLIARLFVPVWDRK